MPRHCIYLYCFSIDAKSETPTGSLNFSRLDNAQLQFTINEETRDHFKNIRRTTENYKANDDNLEINIYATNYNYLIIKSGMAGLAFST